MSNNILFVCSGNTCRSPMAAYIAAAVKEAQFPESDFCFDSAYRHQRWLSGHGSRY